MTKPRNLQYRKPAVTYGERLGLVIYRWRIEKNVTQGQLGEAMCETGGTISRIERGTQSPTFDQICTMARIMEIEPDVLVSRASTVLGEQ